jgi:tol-pal system protein YbgF
VTSRGAAARIRRRTGALVALVLLGSSALTPGCYTTQLGLLRSGLDSLRAQVDTMTARDSVTANVLADMRREVGSQRDLILSSQARQSSTQSELADLMSRLDGRLEEITNRFTKASERANSGALRLLPPVIASPEAASPPAGSSPAVPAAGAVAGAAAPGGSGPSASQLFDLATRDLTEGRYPLALQGYREFLKRYPDTELADNAQYGVGECFFAQAAFDSAAVEYARVGEQWPKGDRAPAALYKLALSQERLGRAADSRKTFEDLVRRFPSSSEAGLARDRLGASQR